MNILLTSVGRRTYLIDYFKQAVKGKGKIVASNSVMTYSLECADDYVITPGIYDDGYIHFLIEYCKKHDINAIISLFDIDLPILAANKKNFEDIGVKLVVSDKAVVELCNDKWKTYTFLKENGFEQPHTFISLSACIAAIETGECQFPVFVKPRWGMGSIGIYQANNMDELVVLYAKLTREIFNTYLKYESKQDINQAILIQEKIKGQEHGIEVLNNLNGEYVITFVKQKMAMRAGETDVAMVIKNEQMENIGKKLSQKLCHIGNLDVDCFLHDNKVYVLEMNCRFGGQYPFTHMAGANVPKQIVEWLENKPTKSENISIQYNTIGCKEILPVKMNNEKYNF